MRTFIAIPLPEPCLKTLAQIQRQLQTCRAEVRWTSVTSIHLTLKFLGEIDPGMIPGLGENLRTASGHLKDFSLRIAGLGGFPNDTRPRVIWCGIRGDLEPLSYLQQMVETACSDFGFPRETRPFQPHLTLGRVKGKRNMNSLLDCIKNGSALECGFSVDHFNIYKSVLQPQGAVYTVLETIALKSALKESQK